jgi:hypothetical protein
MWAQKMAPKTGAIRPKYLYLIRAAGKAKSLALEAVHLRASEAKVGEVTIPHCRAGRGHQQAVDGGHQTAEQAIRGCKPDGGSLGHHVPFSECGGSPSI